MKGQSKIKKSGFWHSQEDRSSWPAFHWSHPPPWTCTLCPGSCARPDKRSGSGRWGKMSFSNQRTKCLMVSWPFITDGIGTTEGWWSDKEGNCWVVKIGSAINLILFGCSPNIVQMQSHVAAFLWMESNVSALADEKKTQFLAFECYPTEPLHYNSQTMWGKRAGLPTKLLILVALVFFTLHQCHSDWMGPNSTTLIIALINF